MLFEILRVAHVYYLRKFEDGRPTTHFASAGAYHSRGYSIYDLKTGVPRGANLVKGETVFFRGLGLWPNLAFSFGYHRAEMQGTILPLINHQFSLEEWSSVRIEVVFDGRDEVLTLTKYRVR